MLVVASDALDAPGENLLRTDSVNLLELMQAARRRRTAGQQLIWSLCVLASLVSLLDGLDRHAFFNFR